MAHPRPPERLETDRLVLRRHQPADAAMLAAAVTSSLDQLRPWMPWATPEAGTEDAQRTRLLEGVGAWEAGTNCEYVVLARDEATLIGTCGLMRRIGPAAVEIGYWIHAGHVGQGYATEAAGALTEAAWTMDDIARVEIHCDEANHRSRAIPPKLGYRLDRVEEDAIEAPGECGRSMIWVIDRPDDR